ncbi:MAG: rod shape-determining protein MreC, partial [Flavobacteriaceae bacterium]|nr:rod shape-determining protein MreC [Flavobacteriaceae bacterium]
NDIQDLVKFTIGDSITTSGFSSIFPANIPVGTINSYRLNDTKDLYIIDVKLFNDMTNLKHVYVVKNTDFKELENLNRSDE